jgi:hypothetical protein
MSRSQSAVSLWFDLSRFTLTDFVKEVKESIRALDQRAYWQEAAGGVETHMCLFGVLYKVANPFSVTPLSGV